MCTATKKGHGNTPMTPSVGIIIYQSWVTMHRPLWCGLGWGLDGLPSRETGRAPTLQGSDWAARLASVAESRYFFRGLRPSFARLGGQVRPPLRDLCLT